MKTITLTVNGLEMNFSEEELATIVKGHLDRKALDTEKVARTPTEDQWFRVIPLSIDPKLFEEKRENRRQEETRRLILEAFAEIKINPEKYGRNFKTMIPKKTWHRVQTTDKFGQIACNLGYNYNMADWVEQCLEWAQRIQNGEAWETLCNKSDTANWYRAIICKNGNVTIVGGSAKRNSSTFHATFAGFDFYDLCCAREYTVPLIVRYDD